MRTLLLSVVAALGFAAAVAACGSNNVGACTDPVATTMTAADGGSVTCQCKGPCGCFWADGGRCPQ